MSNLKTDNMKKNYYFLLAACLSLMLSHIAHGQETTVTGKVTEAKSGEPIAGVNVIVKGTTNGTITDGNGEYSLKVDDGTFLVFSFIGYKNKEAAVTGPRLDVKLEEDVTSLEEVVISGLASNIKRSNLANSVASISAKEIIGTTTPQTVDGALYGKFKGANIVSNSGAPGGGIAVKLRGITSITGSSQPLFIVDGVYVDNSSIAAGLNLVSAAAAGGSASNQDNPSNRIADISPEDIETIEILKGASAASIYGSRSSAGVVVITTKKGTPGKTKIRLEQSVGQATILNPLGTRTFTEQRIRNTYFAPGDNETPQETAEREAAAAAEVLRFQNARDAGLIHDYEDELYGHKGLLLNTTLSASGGNEDTRYYGSFLRKDEEGIVENTGYEKTSMRLNFSHDIVENVNVALTSNYILSTADRGFFNNDNSGTTMGISYISTRPYTQLFPDENGNYPNNPDAPSNFLQTRDLITNREEVQRFIGSAKLEATLYQSDNMQLKFIGLAGLDSYTLKTTALFPRELQFQQGNNGTGGASIQGRTVLENRNLQAFLVHSYFPSNKLSFVTQLGVLKLDFNRNTTLITATQLIGTQSNLDQASAISAEQTIQPEEDAGFFIQEEVNFADQIIATVGVRADKSSNNGDVNKLFYYPKANLALNLHEFGFWGIDAVNTLKLRVAYGQAGRFATFGSKYTGFGSVIIDGQAGSLIGTQLGNQEVEPEKQSEIEAGFDLGVINNRILFDFTYYKKSVTDLLLSALVPTSSGYTSQIINGAELENQGIEMGLNVLAIDKPDLKYNSSLNFWFNRSEVTELRVPAFNTGAFGATLGTLRIEEGKSATQLVGIDPNNPDGVTKWGDAEPDFQMSWNNFITWKNFEFSFLWHWKQGVENVNLSTLLTDLNGTSPDFDDGGLDPTGQLQNGPYRLSQLGVSAEPFVEDASYIRLREVGLYYNLDEDLLLNVFNGVFTGVRVGFSGYNLLNFFDYNSYDPEVSNFGGDGLSTGVEVTPFPSAKRYFFHLALEF